MIDGLICSPPWEESLATNIHTIGFAEITGNMHRKAGATSPAEVKQNYGTASGQLGAMRPGSVSEVVTPGERMGEMETLTWENCYDLGWNGYIVPEAFAHPAKYARGLIERIVDFMLERGWLAKGMICLDPFGGVGLGGILCAGKGIRWVGMELEERFVNLATGYDCSGEVEGHMVSELIPAKAGGWYVRLRPEAAYWTPDGQRHDHGVPDDAPGFATRREAVALARQLFRDQGPEGRWDRRSFTAYYRDPEQSRVGTAWICDKPAPCGKTEQHELHHVTGSFELHRRTWTAFGDPLPVILQGDSRRLAEVVGAAQGLVSSPPYAGSPVAALHGLMGSVGNEFDGRSPRALAAGKLPGEQYGTSPGQLGAMPQGDVGAVISSPPYAGSLEGHADSKHHKSGPDSSMSRARAGRRCQSMNYEGSKDNLGNLPPGSVAAVVAADGVISSSPYAGSINDGLSAADRHKYAPLADAGKGCGTDYGTAAGQLGNTTGPTFWGASRDILLQCRQVLRPGAVSAWVVKNFVRNKKVVDFTGDWARLLESCGFKVFLHVRASLVKEEAHAGLFGKVKARKERKSFFRRLAEKKGSPRIDHESVLFARLESTP